jgi:hypothetical protein
MSIKKFRHKQKTQQNHSHNKPRGPQYQVREIVYLHAYVDPSDQTSYFFCKGIITRQPQSDSPIYKIVITSVDPKSLLCGENPQQAKRLLGKRIVRREDQITSEISDMMTKMYEGHGWIDLPGGQIQQIINKIDKEQINDRGHKDGSSGNERTREEKSNLETS